MDRIVTSRPVDATAARVVQPGPKGMESGRKHFRPMSETPYPMRSLRRAERNNPSFVDLTDRRVGSLTVVGLSTIDGRWCCRCVCGYYTLRTARALKNPENVQQDTCDRCETLRLLRKRDRFNQTGQWEA